MVKRKVENNIKISGVFMFITFLFFVAVIIRISYLSLSKEVDGIKLHPQYEAKAFERMEELNLVNKDTLFYIIGQEINKEDI